MLNTAPSLRCPLAPEGPGQPLHLPNKDILPPPDPVACALPLGPSIPPPFPTGTMAA